MTDTPATAVARELEEELSVYVPEFMTIGPFSYKRSLHMVYAAEVTEPIHDYDDSELLDIRWFSVSDIQALKVQNRLHANYELDAIQALLQKLGD